MSSTQKLSIAALFAVSAACGAAERPLTGKLDLAAFGRTGATIVAVRDDGVVKTAELASDGSFELGLEAGHSHAIAFRGDQRGRTATFANLVFKTEGGRRASSIRCEDGEAIELGELRPEDGTDDDHSSCRGLPDDDDAPDGGTTTGTTSPGTDDNPGSDTPGTDDNPGAGDLPPEIVLFTSALVSGDTVSDDLAGDDHGTDSPLSDSDDDDRPDALDDDFDDDGVCNDDDDDGDEPSDDDDDAGEPGDDDDDAGEPGDDDGGGDEPGDDDGGSSDDSSDEEESDLPYDYRLSVGDSFGLEDAFLSSGPLPAQILSIEMEGGSWRLAELQAGTRFTVTEADCTHEGNRDVGRDRIFVAWVNADGSTDLDHVDLRYCGR